MGSRSDEFRRGLRVTRRYLLSHHEPDEWDRCHAIAVSWADRPVRLCARCSGVYPGIAAGIGCASMGLLPVAPLLVAVLPLAALVDWSVTTFTDCSGSNLVRTGTGFLLGLGYGLGLVALTRPDDRRPVLAVGLGYALVAGALLALSLRDRRTAEKG